MPKCAIARWCERGTKRHSVVPLERRATTPTKRQLSRNQLLCTLRFGDVLLHAKDSISPFAETSTGVIIQEQRDRDCTRLVQHPTSGFTSCCHRNESEAKRGKAVGLLLLPFRVSPSPQVHPFLDGCICIDTVCHQQLEATASTTSRKLSRYLEALAVLEQLVLFHDLNSTGGDAQVQVKKT